LSHGNAPSGNVEQLERSRRSAGERELNHERSGAGRVREDRIENKRKRRSTRDARDVIHHDIGI